MRIIPIVIKDTGDIANSAYAIAEAISGAIEEIKAEQSKGELHKGGPSKLEITTSGKVPEAYDMNREQFKEMYESEDFNAFSRKLIALLKEIEELIEQNSDKYNCSFLASVQYASGKCAVVHGDCIHGSSQSLQAGLVKMFESNPKLKDLFKDAMKESKQEDN